MTPLTRLREATALASAPALVRPSGDGPNDGSARDTSTDGIKPCPDCDGTGATDDGGICPTCNGSAEVMSEADQVSCPTCHGDGKILGGKRTCPDCHGSGKLDPDSPVLKESAVSRDSRMLRHVKPIDFLDDGALRERAVKQFMAEKDYSTDTRVQMAKDGRAIPIKNDAGDVVGGSYPINDGGDVDDAIQSFGRNATPEVKAHIVKRAKAVGTSDQQKRAQTLGSTSESSTTTVIQRLERLEREVGPLRSLREAKPSVLNATFSTPTRVTTSDGQQGYKVVLIREGLGNSQDDRWYPGSAIKEMCESGVAEGMQAYADHPDLEQEQIQPERSVRQLVGHYRDVKFQESGGVPRAEAVLVPITLNENHPTYGWVVSLAEAAANNTGPQPLCGISLYGYSATDYGNRPNGSEGAIATLIRPASGDLVTNAGAGGGFVRRLMESARALRNSNRKERPMLAAEYKSKLAEASKRLREADSDEARTAAMAELDALQSVDIDAPAALPNTIEAITESAPQLVAQLRETATKEMKTTVEELQSQLRESNERLGTAEKFITGITDVRTLAERLREAGVTDEVEMRYFVAQAQTRGLREAADIKDMVETERAYHKRHQDALDERLKEATFEIEGVWGRVPDGDITTTVESNVAVLKESGVPTRKPETAAAAA